MAFIIETRNQRVDIPDWEAVDGFVWHHLDLATKSLAVHKTEHPNRTFRLRKISHIYEEALASQGRCVSA